MAFLGHHPCPKCNSRDNLAEYSDGFYCFGCNYYDPKQTFDRFKPRELVKGYDGITLEKSLDLEHLKWLLKYNLTQDEMKHFGSCKERSVNGQIRKCNLLIFLHTDNYWVGRNFDTGVKYLSSGIKPYTEYGNNKDVLVFVEDVLSAIKVARVATAVPMLGAKVQREWWEYTKPYKRVIIWGDRDKAKENIIESRRVSEMLGRKVENVITEKDPKEYNNIYINNIIYN